MSSSGGRRTITGHSLDVCRERVAVGGVVGARVGGSSWRRGLKGCSHLPD